MTVDFKKLIEITQPLFRNILGTVDFDEFDDLTDDSEARTFAHQWIDKVNYPADKLQYEAIDYIFELKQWWPTRFGNGQFPVWYASIDLKTSFYETFYHWQKSFIESPQGFRDSKDPIKTRRTVFTVNCKAAVIDLRDDKEKISRPDPMHYPVTQKIGIRIHKEGYPGLLTKSSRIKDGENTAIFRKEVLFNPQYYSRYIYEHCRGMSTVKDKDDNQVDQLTF